jgi:Ca2+-binding EF-hand superfamily protein
MRQVFAFMAAGLLAGAGAVIADEGGRVGDHHGWGRGAVLEKYDANKNGQLDADEKAAFERDREARREEFIKKFDTDGDGKLSEAEKEAAREQFPRMDHGRHGREMHQRMLEKYDANKNGQLDPEEREVARRDREARREEFMKRFDSDGDGKLSDSEREAARAEMRKERGEKGGEKRF